MLIRSLLLWGCVIGLCAEAPPDVSYTKDLRYALKREGEKYVLGALIRVQQKTLTEQGTRYSDFSVAEQSRTKITRMTGRFRGRDLFSSAFTFRYPTPVGTFTPPSKVYDVNLPGEVRPGDEVMYEYAVSYDDPVYFPLVSVPALNRVDRFTLTVEHPKDVKVDFELYSPGGDLHPEIEHKPEESHITFRNLPPPALLHNNPFSGQQAVIQTRLSVGDKPLSSHTPEAFCRWYCDQLDKLGDPSEQMKNFLAEELAKAASPMAKARMLFDFVKAQVRYIGDEGDGHAFIPHPPADVFSKKYGDCKDKAWLLSVFGRLHGLEIHPVLLSTGFEPEFKDLNMGLFNHVICAMELDGRLIFMDPTATYSELGVLPDQDLLARGFLLDPRQPRWVEITDSRVVPSVELTLNADLSDPRHGKAKVLLRHDWFSMAVRARKEMKSLDLENLLSNRLNRLLTKVSIDHLKAVDEGSGTLTLEADADLSDFIVSTELRTYVPASPFRVLSRDYLERGKDTFPVNAEGPDAYKLKVQLKGAAWQAKPIEVRLGGDGKASFLATLSGNKEMVSLDYSYSQPFRLLPPSEREGFLEFCSQYLQLNRKPFMLQRNTP